MAWLWCTYLPHLVHLLTFLSLVGYVSPPRVSPLCYGSFVAGSEFGWANCVFRQCMRGLCEGLWHWCGAHTVPLLVHLLTFLSLLGNVSHNMLSSRVMLPSSQHVSLVGQMAFFGNAREGCVRGCGMGVVHTPTPSCALANVPFSLGLCVPAACFPPVSFFLQRSP